MDNYKRLEEITNLVNFQLFHLADKRIDELYEEFTQGKIRLTENETDWMFNLIDRISTELYG